jgi:hypothetical protein
MAAEPLDDYIDAVAKALALPVEDAWRPCGAGEPRSVSEAGAAGR